MYYASSWSMGNYGLLKAMDETKLWKTMEFPEVKTIYLPNTEYAKSLNISGVEYSSLTKLDNEIDLMIFNCNILDHYRMLHLSRSCHGGLPFVSVGLDCDRDPEVLVAHIRFWLSLHMFCHHPERYKRYMKGINVGIAITKDSISEKARRLWIKKVVKYLRDEDCLDRFLEGKDA